MEVFGLSRVCNGNHPFEEVNDTNQFEASFWVEPLSGSKLTNFLKYLMLLFYVRNIFK